MNFDQINREDLLAFSSEILVKYLLRLNWELVTPPKPLQFAILRKTFEKGEEEILVPKNREFADYSDRVFDVLKNISLFENCPLKDVLENLTTLDADILKIRISGDNIGNGSMSYLDEAAIFEGFKKVLNATACHVLEPKPFYTKLRRAESEQWLKSCRSGLTEAGSYVLKLIFPITGSKDSKNKVGEIPFSRKVTERLMKSLSSLAKYLEDENASTIDTITGDQLSANLCFGLAEMKPSEKTDFTFCMSWGLDIPHEMNIPSKATIYDHYIPKISQIGAQLKPQKGIKEDSFVGKILSLNGSPNDEGQMQGDVNFSILVEEESVKAKAWLNPSFYEKACDAHKNNQYIKLKGILHERPRCCELKEVSSFEVLEK